MTLEIGINGFNRIGVSWHDNEWGYSCRIIDLMLFMAKIMAKNEGLL
jgi:hypothetical protein